MRMPPETGARRRSLTTCLLVAGWLLTGCSTLAAGQPVPADHDGPIPVKDSALRNALLDGEELDTIMNTSDMKEQRSTDKPYSDDATVDSSCLAAWQPLQQSVYQDSGYSAIRAKMFHDYDSTSSDGHAVWESVVSFSARTDATDFFEQLSGEWTSCSDRQLTVRSSSGNIEWKLGAVDTDKSTLSMTQTKLHSQGWSCQHALRLTNNVIIDAMACMTDTADEAKTIVEEIDAKLPSI